LLSAAKEFALENKNRRRSIRGMPHSPHRRRHHSGPDADRWFYRAAVWLLLLVVGFLLGALFARSRPSAVTLLSIGSVLGVVALVGLSYGIARVAAAVRNTCALYSAHVDLARFMRTNESFRAARRDVHRPKP
jgi:hypothetical protein